MTNLIVSPSLTWIGSHAIKGCTALTNFYPTPGATYVGDYCFMNCSMITNIEVSANATHFGDRCFADCSKLETFTPRDLPRLTYIGPASFGNDALLGGDWYLRAWNSIGTSSAGGGFNGCRPENVTLKVMGGVAITDYVFSSMAAGGGIWWECETAPASLGKGCFKSIDDGNYLRIYVKNGYDRAAWESLCTRTRENLTATDLARPDYPAGRNVIGLIDSNNNKAWVIRWSKDEATLLLVR